MLFRINTKERSLFPLVRHHRHLRRHRLKSSMCVRLSLSLALSLPRRKLFGLTFKSSISHWTFSNVYHSLPSPSFITDYSSTRHRRCEPKKNTKIIIKQKLRTLFLRIDYSEKGHSFHVVPRRFLPLKNHKKRSIQAL